MLICVILMLQSLLFISTKLVVSIESVKYFTITNSIHKDKNNIKFKNKLVKAFHNIHIDIQCSTEDSYCENIVLYINILYTVFCISYSTLYQYQYRTDMHMGKALTNLLLNLLLFLSLDIEFYSIHLLFLYYHLNDIFFLNILEVFLYLINNSFLFSFLILVLSVLHIYKNYFFN